jgi:hypothetical protein
MGCFEITVLGHIPQALYQAFRSIEPRHSANLLKHNE